MVGNCQRIAIGDRETRLDVSARDNKQVALLIRRDGAAEAGDVIQLEHAFAISEAHVDHAVADRICAAGSEDRR